jgi:hypothetical protein
MEMQWNQVRFTVPPGYFDETSYSFKDKRRQELVEVNYGQTTPHAPDLGSVMEDRLAGLRNTYGDRAKVEPTSGTTLAGLPALQTSFQLSGENPITKEWWVMAMLAPNSYVLVSYTAPLIRKTATATFETIRKSVSLAKSESDSAPPQFVRRSAGQISLDIPRVLDPPPVCLLETPDRKARITVSTYDAKAAATPGPLSEAVAADTRYGAVVSEQQNIQRMAGNGSLQAVRYILTKQISGEPAQQVIVRGRLDLAGGITVAVNGSMDLPSAGNMDRDIATLLESIAPH